MANLELTPQELSMLDLVLGDNSRRDGDLTGERGSALGLDPEQTQILLGLEDKVNDALGIPAPEPEPIDAPTAPAAPATPTPPTPGVAESKYPTLEDVARCIEE